MLFWGTPEFAAPALRALLGEGFEVCGVVTQPDKPQGRSRTIVHSPIKQIALTERVPLFQPSSAKDPELAELLSVMQPDISVVVAYGHLLPQHIIDLPRLGTLNIHASLLPKLRGAAPIQAAIRDGYSETGVTIMRMVLALDAGPVVLQSRTPIADDETYGELYNRLAELGALTLIEALALISLGAAKDTPQRDASATHAPKVDRAMARIDWTRSAREVANVIRAYDPRPGAFTTLKGNDVKLYGARILSGSARVSPGTVVSLDGGMAVAAADGGVQVTDVQPAGKRRMPAHEWAGGRGVAVGDVLE